MAKSTRKPKSGKAVDRPKKPYPDFPLYAHPLGYWSKKIRGEIRHFGRWGRVRNKQLEWIREDGCWQEALALYNAQKEDLHAGRTPRKADAEGLTIRSLCNQFLTSKLRKIECGDIARRTFEEYQNTCSQLISRFGKNRLVEDLRPDDFRDLRADLAARYGPVRLGNEIQRVRSIFKHATVNGLIDKTPQFGNEFQRPDKATMRKHRASRPKRLFKPDEIQLLLDHASVELKAQILLGINAAFGNTDCACLPKSTIDFENGWVAFPRPKNGIARRCKLWPETLQALQDAIARRPDAAGKADRDCVFITKQGQRWVKDHTDSVGLYFRKMLDKLDLKQPGRAFYSLRHTFRTVADNVPDQPAIRTIMGHADGSIDDVYRERIDDERLVAVTDHVRVWLFGTDTEGDRDKPETENAAETLPLGDPAPDDDDDTPSLRLFIG